MSARPTEIYWDLKSKVVRASFMALVDMGTHDRDELIKRSGRLPHLASRMLNKMVAEGLLLVRDNKLYRA